jgi:hypothetical protein
MGNSLARTDCLSVRGCISQQPKSWYMKLTSQILSLACLIPFGNVSCRRLQFPLAAVVLPLAHCSNTVRQASLRPAFLPPQAGGNALTFGSSPGVTTASSWFCWHLPERRLHQQMRERLFAKCDFLSPGCGRGCLRWSPGDQHISNQVSRDRRIDTI